ncbi:hypothetical protein JCM3774_002444 [Rhodotorula dairenensis]
MGAAPARGRRNSTRTAAPPPSQASEATGSILDASLEHFDPLAGYTEHRKTATRASDAQRTETQQRGDATTSTSFGVKSDRADSQIGQPSRHGSRAMQRSNSSEMGRAGDVKVARRESWHAGQTSTTPDSEEAELLRSSASGNTARLRRRSTSAQIKHKVAALQPPKLPELRESDNEFRSHVELEKTSSLHHLPLVLVAIPSLGAILHGRAENWSDAIVLALVVFYLYNLIKIPWEMYYASYTRKILPSALLAAGADEAEAQDDPTLRAIRLASAAQLKRAELFSLSLTFLVPAVGAALLFFARGMLSDPDRYINRFLIGLFALASSIKPISHAIRLLKQKSLYHQEIVHYPSPEIVRLKKRLEQLEAMALRRSTTDSEESRTAPAPAAPSVSPEQLDTLSRSFRRHTLAAAHFQTTTSARLDDLAHTISQLVEVVEAQEGEIVRLQQQQQHEEEAVERVTAPVLHRQRSSRYAAGGILKGVVRHLLLYLAYPPRQRRRSERRRSLLHRLVSAAAFVPVTAPKKAIGWAVEKSARGAVHLLGWEDGSFDGHEDSDDDNDEDGDDEDQAARRRRTISGTENGGRRGLPAPPMLTSTTSIPLPPKVVPGGFVPVSERLPLRAVPFRTVEESPAPTAAERAGMDFTAGLRQTGLGPSPRDPLPVRAGGAAISYSARRTASGTAAAPVVHNGGRAGGGAGARLVSAH